VKGAARENPAASCVPVSEMRSSTSTLLSCRSPFPTLLHYQQEILGNMRTAVRVSIVAIATVVFHLASEPYAWAQG
jgi:hypothetical protein